MRKYSFTEKGHTFKRIDKKTARTAALAVLKNLLMQTVYHINASQHKKY